jgi:hypothetical protein
VFAGTVPRNFVAQERAAIVNTHNKQLEGNEETTRLEFGGWNLVVLVYDIKLAALGMRH